VELKPILRTTTSFSGLTLLVVSFDPQKPVPDMTYNVFSGTLNPTQSINLLFVCLSVPRRIPTLLQGPGCKFGNGSGAL